MTHTTTTTVSYRQTSTGRTVLYGPADMLVQGRTVYVHGDFGTCQTKAELVGKVLDTKDGMAQALIGHRPSRPVYREAEDDFSAAQYREWRSA